MTTRICSFAPVARPDARVLVLGSMPGKRSLEQGEYYAHPQNAFWKIMATLTGAPAVAPYPQRLESLQAAGIALWDVLASCERHGSLDADISAESVNDFSLFFCEHAGIARVFFNGAKAAQSFHKFVLGRQDLPPLIYTRLPSTSPAHAGLDFAAKLAAWRVIMDSGPV
jgi:hypoxanthine-DNA glycosylase